MDRDPRDLSHIRLPRHRTSPGTPTPIGGPAMQVCPDRQRLITTLPALQTEKGKEITLPATLNI